MAELLNSNKRGNYICISLSILKTLIRNLRKIHTSVSIIPRGWGNLLSLVSNFNIVSSFKHFYYNMMLIVKNSQLNFYPAKFLTLFDSSFLLIFLIDNP